MTKMDEIMLDLGDELKSNDRSRPMRNKKLAALLNDETFLRDFTVKLDNALRDVIDEK